MRTSVPTPANEPLPFFGKTRLHPSQSDDDRVHALDDAVALPQLRGEAIARFDALLHEINPDAVRVDPDRLHQLMVWLVALTPTRAQHLLDRRLRRVEELRAMVEDFDWDTDPATRARLAKLVDYIDRDEDLIADHQPMLGLLDDVLLIELAWPAFATEAEEYRDFCAYRDDEHSDGGSEQQRAAWVRDRVAEIALWRHHWRVSEGHYVASGEPGPRFTIT